MQTPERRLKLGQSAPTEQPLIPGLPDAVADQCLLRVPYDHLSLLHSVCRRWRNLLRSADYHARRRLAGITRPLLVLHIEEIRKSSYKSYVTLFDPVSGTWRLLNRGHKVLLSMTRSSTIIGAGRSMVSIGWRGSAGWRGSSPVRIYDFHTGHWREGAPFPGQDGHFRAVAWNGASRVFVVSGESLNAMERVVRSVNCYDMEEDKWEALADMPTTHFSLAAACHNGAFRRLRVSSGNRGKLQIDSFDESSGEWGAEELEGLKFDFPSQRMFAFGQDGIIFCCHEGKLLVRKHGEDGWRELVELPSHVVNCVYLTSWKGGVLVAGTVSNGGQWDFYPLNVYTLRLEENDPTPLTWIAQSVPNAGSEGHYLIKGFWLQI